MMGPDEPSLCSKCLYKNSPDELKTVLKFPDSHHLYAIKHCVPIYGPDYPYPYLKNIKQASKED
jgi:hypothetical protein